MNKILTKQLYVQAGIATAPYVVVDRAQPGGGIGTILESLGLPVVVKPEHEGSSIGLSIVKEGGDLAGALELAYRYDRRCLVERYIAGTEITGGVLGNDSLQALPLVEIIPGDQYEFFDYAAKYTPGASHEICPARIPEDVTRRAQDLALRAHRALYCRGYSRTDMIVSGDEIHVLETNTIPGMTQTSLLPQAAAKAGLSFSALLDRLIELALER